MNAFSWCRAMLSLLLATTLGCSPTLNWREVRPEGSGAVAMFPCKPTQERRQVPLAGAPVPMTVMACRAGGVMYALAFADLGDPTRVGPALDVLRDAAVSHIGAQVSSSRAAQVEGMTPNAKAQRLALQGRLPDGTQVEEQLAVFTRGTRVFQATMLGARLDAEAADNFFTGLRLPS